MTQKPGSETANGVDKKSSSKRSRRKKNSDKNSARGTKMNGPARRSSKGDIAPSITPEGIQQYTVEESVTAAQEAKINAVTDIVKAVPPHDAETLVKVMNAILKGTSPDDAAVLRKALSRKQAMDGAVDGNKSDAALSSDWRAGGYPYRNLLSRKSYEKQKYRLQVELLKLQSWVRKTGQRLMILFEGRDAAGKGGTIKRFMEHLNPRGARVVALEKPTDVEQGQWYFQRYVEHFPTRGEIVMFDRS